MTKQQSEKNSSKNIPLTIVIACYNEAEHLKSSVGQLITTLDINFKNYKLIFIDDKSQDKTVDILKDIKKEYRNRNFSFLYHTKNHGRGATVSEGIKLAKSQIVGFIDIDLEISPVYLAQFIEKIASGNADVAIAKRYYPFKLWPPNYLIREILSRGYLLFTKRFLDHPFSDTEAGYKFFNTQKILPVLAKTEDKHWFWDTEIVMRSYLEGLEIVELPVLFLRREDKTSTVKIIPDTITFFKSALKFRKRLKSNGPVSNGLLYHLPFLYPVVMKLLFGSKYSERYKAVVKLVEKNSSVVDVCCGDAKLASFAKEKNIDYLGMDASLEFVKQNLKRGIKTRWADTRHDPIPEADYVIMQASLYQFSAPNIIVNKLINSARKAVIISESIHNIDENVFFNNRLAKFVTSILVGTHRKEKLFRYDEESFKSALKPFNPRYVEVPGKRDLIAIIRK